MVKMIALPCRAVQCSGSVRCSCIASTVESRSLMGPRFGVFNLCFARFFLLALLFYLHVSAVLKSKAASYDNVLSSFDSVQNLDSVGPPNAHLYLVLVGY